MTVDPKAPRGAFRVIGWDTFEGGPDCDCHLGDWTSLEEAKKMATKYGKPMFPVYVNDDTGKEVFMAGSISGRL